MADQAGADGQTVEQQLGAQIVRLNQNEQELRRMISTLQARVDAQDVEIQRSQRRGRHRGKGGISDSDDEEPEERRQAPQDIVDRKFFNPSPFTSSSVFKEWSEDFRDIVFMRNETLAEGLDNSRYATVTIASVGDTPKLIKEAQKLDLVLRKLMEYPPARVIVNNAAQKTCL